MSDVSEAFELTFDLESVSAAFALAMARLIIADAKVEQQVEQERRSLDDGGESNMKVGNGGGCGGQVGEEGGW
jgi:hypothetical protein